VTRLGIGDEFVPGGDTEQLLAERSLTAGGIADAVRALIGVPASRTAAPVAQKE
jgi:deoxyxylulose-5-phosphate synthase